MMGAPTKYKPEMNALVIEMMKEGATKVQVAAALDIDRNTIMNWCNPEHDSFQPDFFSTVKKGVSLAQAYWEERLKEAAIGVNKDANMTGMIFVMKNMFKEDWADVNNQHITVKKEINSMSDEELERIAAGGKGTSS